MRPFRRHVAGLIVLFVLTVAPVSGAICAALCVPSTSVAGRAAADRHAAQTHCQPAVAGRATLRAMSGHGCGGHDAPAPETTATPAAARADAGMRPLAQQVADRAAPHLSAPTGRRVQSGSGPPNGTAVRARVPLVLRI